MSKFILMNKNVETMIIEKNDEDWLFEDYYKVLNDEWLPLSIYHALDSDNRLEVIKSINAWFDSRIVPDYRDNKNEIFKEYAVTGGHELASKHFALSLSDQYWLKPLDSDISWSEINYFENNYDGKSFFETTYGKGSFDTLNVRAVDMDKYSTPNNTLGGQLKKAWIKYNDDNYLIKGSSALYPIEPINEVIASKICKILDVPYVQYELKHIQTKRQQALVSVCKCMIDSSHEIIPAYQILKEAHDRTNTIADYYKYVEILEEHGIVNANEIVQKMFMIDYIMLNEDRHLNNFGIIRNVESLKWVGVCPIFDTGRSNNCNVTEPYWDFKTGEIKCFTKQFISSERLLDLFTISLDEEFFDQLRSIAKEYRVLLKQNQAYIKLFDEQIENLSKGLETRIEMFYDAMLKKNLITKK